MNILNVKPILCLFAAGSLWAASAAIPPAEQLLPSDTLALLSVPDWSKVEAARKEAPFFLLWDDAAVRPFRDKLLTKLTNDLVAPLERELGVKLADYADLLQGQFTLALTQNGWTGGGEPMPGLLLLLDTRDKAELLKKNLSEVKKKLADAGRKMRTDKIRDVEFTTLILSPDDLRNSLGKGAESAGNANATDKKEAAPAKPEGEAKAGPSIELRVGQVDSLLVVGTSAKDLERLLARLAGSGAGYLAEVPAFEADARELFRDVLAFGWIHFAPVNEILTKLAAPAEGAADNENPMLPRVDKLLAALGLSSLRTLAFNDRQTADGMSVNLFLGTPEEKRRGVFNLLATEVKDAAPPAFVPADAVRFSRWRADGQKFWASIEGIVNEIAPGVLGFLVAQIEAAMKEKDPAFDFKKNLVGNLGDDVISYEKAPRGTAIEDLNSAPTLTLLASANAEQLLQGLRSALIMLPPPFNTAAVKDREFQGRKIYSLPLPAMPTGDNAKPVERSLHFAVSGGYLAFTTDAAMIEEYLRSGETKPKPLAEKAGLAEASQQVGGMATGLFGYQNDAENMHVLLEVLRSNTDLFTKALAFSPLAPKTGDADKALKEWLDFSLLPPFDKISKYFGITVYTGRVSKEGYTLKMFTPKPPQMKQ